MCLAERCKMFPGMDPRAVKQAMRKLGMQQEDIQASEVVIKTLGKDIVILNPQVAKVKMMGQVSWQITGEADERPVLVTHTPHKPAEKFTQEDVDMVMQQANVNADAEREALEASDGDIAQAIM